MAGSCHGQGILNEGGRWCNRKEGVNMNLSLFSDQADGILLMEVGRALLTRSKIGS